MPRPDQLAAALGRAGAAPGSFVVIYCRSHNTMAARLWWMLSAIGFDGAAVLNGGWKRWTSEGRPTSAKATAYLPATLMARPRHGGFVGRGVVLGEIGEREI